MNTGDPSSLPELEREILGYLLRNPLGEDSIDGIVEWWLLEQRILQATQDVRMALAALREQGFIESRTVRGGVTVYRLNLERKQAAELHLTAASMEGSPP